MAKHTIIISELSKQETLSVPRTIKSEIVQYQGDNQLTDKDIIEHWTELPGLSRLVIILKEPKIAQDLFHYLRELHPNLRIHLSESIFPRHKSFDGTLDAPLTPEPELYSEPKPIFQKEAHFPKSEKKILLNLHTSVDRPVKLENGTISPVSPSITLEHFDE